METKNIIVLAMSTLPERIKNITDMMPGRFTWNGQETYEYIGQLEPISTMIRTKEGSLDRVIILATRETMEKTHEYQGNMISAVEFYMQRMGLKEENVRVIGVEEDDFVPAISSTVEEIRKYWDENMVKGERLSNKAEGESSGKEVKLWIDTQGSFRNINLVLNAVITLLKTDGIVPSGIYSLNYNPKKSVQPIKDQTMTYKIFAFVSGINEFTQSGRAEQLMEYYGEIGQPVPESIVLMGKIAEAIQMCDMRMFDRELENFRKLYREDRTSEDVLLGIFRDQIRRDYGELLSERCTGLDVIGWFYKKGFYQQAITYIESKMPEEWVRKGILSWKANPAVMQKLKKELNKRKEKDAGVLVVQLTSQCFSWNALCQKDEGKSVKIRYTDLKKLDKGIRYEYADPESWHQLELTVYKGKNEIVSVGRADVTIHCKNQKRVMRLLLLYKLLKNERNKFNHMAEDDVRADRAHLGEAIGLFIKTGEAVYDDIC